MGGGERGGNKAREYPRGLQNQITNSANKQNVGRQKPDSLILSGSFFMKEEIEYR